MKKLVLVLLLIVSVLISGCNTGDISSTEKEVDTSGNITSEEMKRIDLYVTAMKAAFNEENGGKSFIAVEMDTLEGLSDEGKKEVLNRLEDLSSDVYAFEEIKDDNTKFEKDGNGNLRRAIDGTLLSVRLEKFKGNNAIIEATSWFGNLGAVFPKYEAKYKDGKWELKLLSMAVS